jgi:hypothetical protein
MGALLDLDFVGRQDRLVGKKSWKVNTGPADATTRFLLEVKRE